MVRAFPLVILFGAACAPPELCGEGVTPTIEGLSPDDRNGLLHAAHAHNDYEHARPLDDALAQGFASVEVDVWFRDGDMQVSHDAFTSKGTLDALYLDPLQALLATRDSVHNDDAPFTLWIDLKDGTPELRAALVRTLSARDFLTTFDDAGVIEQRAVTVIFTGDAASKKALVEQPAPRPFARDDNGLSVDDEVDGRVVAAALSFGSFIGGWDGNGDVPQGMSRQCGCVVERAHALGRKVRLFGGPDTEAAWVFQLEHGVDFINTDDLSGLAAFLRAR